MTASLVEYSFQRERELGCFGVNLAEDLIDLGGGTYKVVLGRYNTRSLTTGSFSIFSEFNIGKESFNIYPKHPKAQPDGDDFKWIAPLEVGRAGFIKDIEYRRGDKDEVMLVSGLFTFTDTHYANIVSTGGDLIFGHYSLQAYVFDQKTNEYISDLRVCGWTLLGTCVKEIQRRVKK